MLVDNLGPAGMAAERRIAEEVMSAWLVEVEQRLDEQLEVVDGKVEAAVAIVGTSGVKCEVLAQS